MESITDVNCREVPISQLKVGTVVRLPGKSYRDEQFGHVVRFSRSSKDELLLRVLWEDGDEVAADPTQLDIML